MTTPQQRMESAKVLRGRAHTTRRELDGTWERVREGMRRRYAF